MHLSEALAWIAPILITGLIVILPLELRRRVQERLARRPSAQPDFRATAIELLLHWPAILVLGLGAASTLIGLWPLPEKQSIYLQTVLRISLVGGLLIFSLEVLRLWRSRCIDEHPIRRPMVYHAIRIALFVLCGLLVLEILNIHTFPVLLPTGILGGALAISLREMVRDLFCGMQLGLTGLIRKGDFIRVEGQGEGQIKEVGWMNTRLIVPGGTLLIVPNHKIVGSTVHSLNPAVEPIRVEIRFSITGDCTIEKAVKSALAVARGVLKDSQEKKPTAEPEIMVLSISAKGAQLQAVLPVAEVGAIPTIQDAYWVALAKRFKTDKIEFGDL